MSCVLKSFSTMTQRDEVDNDVNLGNLVFDENNQERRSWKFFGHKLSRSAAVFVFQCTVILSLLFCAVVRIIISKSCEETTIWVTLLTSSIAFVLPSPKQLHFDR